MPLWVVGPVLASQDARDQDAAGRSRYVKIPEAQIPERRFLARAGREEHLAEEGDRPGCAGDGGPLP
jgi:hypothetical protein